MGRLRVEFDWTVPNSPSADLVGFINLPMSNAVQFWVEDTYDNNKAEAKVNIEGLVDISVSAWPFKQVYTIPWHSPSVNIGVNVRATRKDSGSDPVPVTLTVDGPAGPKEFSFDLSGGNSKTVQYYFTATDSGEWTVSAEAWPVPTDMESYPPDNRTETRVSAVKQEPYTGPKEPGLHPELID